MADIQKILDDIKELKLLEVAELVKLMEANDYETCYKNLETTLEVVRILEACRE